MKLGLKLPPGHRLVSLAEDESLLDPMVDHNVAAWPSWLTELPSLTHGLWPHLWELFPEYQVVLLDAGGRIAAAHNSAPLRWDGTDDGLPAGWDQQFALSVAQREDGVLPNTLGALQIVVARDRQGAGLSGLMVEAMRANARAHGLGALIACVRPTLKDRYPTIPIERYATWTREDGLPFDPWIRLHARIGGRIVRPAPTSMAYRASVADWEAQTGMAFPESGSYVVPGAAALVEIDRQRDEGVYFDPNVWMVHDLD